MRTRKQGIGFFFSKLSIVVKIYEREVMFAQVDREIEKDMINLDNELIPSIFNTEKYEYVILSIIK